MDAEHLFKVIARHLGNDLSENTDTAVPERVHQYNAVFGSDVLEKVKTAIGGVTGGHLFDSMMNTRWRKVIAANPCLETIAPKIKIEGVLTNTFATKTVVSTNDEALILIDSSTMLFLWQMNKAFLYGPLQLSQAENTKLYFDIFLHFATLRQANSLGGIYPRAKTPPHKNANELKRLKNFVEFQETFLLCHELAHTYSGLGLEMSTEMQSKSDYERVYTDYFPANPKINEELIADELAFEWTLNTIDRSNLEDVETACTAIFLMIRYFLWLQRVYVTLEGDTESHLWLARNNFMRQKIRQVYTWGKPSFIVDLFDHLESTLEPASLAAAEAMQIIRLKKF